jgi:hypothetical protein
MDTAHCVQTGANFLHGSRQCNKQEWPILTKLIMQLDTISDRHQNYTMQQKEANCGLEKKKVSLKLECMLLVYF